MHSHVHNMHEIHPKSINVHCTLLQWHYYSGMQAMHMQEKFTTGYFHVKIVHCKVVLSQCIQHNVSINKPFVSNCFCSIFYSLTLDVCILQSYTTTSHEHRYIPSLTDYRKAYRVMVYTSSGTYRSVICTRMPVSQGYRMAGFINYPNVTKDQLASEETVITLFCLVGQYSTHSSSISYQILLSQQD